MKAVSQIAVLALLGLFLAVSAQAVPKSDPRLGKILDLLLAGEDHAAADLEAKLPPLPAESPAPWLSPPGETRKAGQGPDVALRRLIVLWLRPAEAGDPFERLTVGLAMLPVWREREHLFLARLARRESYPGITGFALQRWIAIYCRLHPDKVGSSIVQAWQAEAEAAWKIAPEPPRAAEAAVSKAVYGPESSTSLDRILNVRLDIFLDHAGTRAYAIWSKPSEGTELRMAKVKNEWQVEVVGSWVY